jgi:hypothetical protein
MLQAEPNLAASGKLIRAGRVHGREAIGHRKRRENVLRHVIAIALAADVLD